MTETPILDERAVSEIEAKMRVKDFTYYPLMSTLQCAFRIVNKGSVNTYHQCSKYARQTIEGYSFCLRHAAMVRAATASELEKL